MTSSLVGSEMCIRDRSLNPNATDGPVPLDELALIATNGVSRVLSPDSVSYTHLTLPTICSV
eukprot:7878968-Prorocentrum_lima.AAC.1